MHPGFPSCPARRFPAKCFTMMLFLRILFRTQVNTDQTDPSITIFTFPKLDFATDVHIRSLHVTVFSHSPCGLLHSLTGSGVPVQGSILSPSSYMRMEKLIYTAFPLQSLARELLTKRVLHQPVRFRMKWSGGLLLALQVKIKTGGMDS